MDWGDAILLAMLVATVLTFMFSVGNGSGEYFEFHKQTCEKMQAITKAKNSDYTGAGDDPFANFSSVEQRQICTTEQGFLTRMNDKFERLISFNNKGSLQVKDESVEDTLLDLANYCILMAGYLKSKSHAQVRAEYPQDKIEGC